MLLPRFFQNRRANFTTITALVFPAVIALGAISIDQGSLHIERRDLQGVADLAAIAASIDPARAKAIVEATFADNGMRTIHHVRLADASATTVKDVEVEISYGTYTPNPSLQPEQRFTETQTRGNAVRVRARKAGTLFFGSSIRTAPVIGVTAIGSSTPEASFSIGSRLARLDGGIINRLLAGITGRPISLTAMDYNALVSADVSLFAFLDKLNTNLSLKAVTYDQVLASRLSLGSLTAQLATMEGLQAGAAASLRKLALQLGSTSALVDLRKLIDPGARGRSPTGPVRRGSDPRLSIMELINAATLVSISDGKRQIATDLDLSIAGLTSLSMVLAVGEPPQGSGWLKVGHSGEVVHTAQTRVTIIATILGAGGILGTSIKVPLYVEIASGEATLSSVACSDGTPATARIGVNARPGIATVRLAEVAPARMSDFSRAVPLEPAALVTIPAVAVTGSANLTITNGAPSPLTFTARDIEVGTVKRVQTRDITRSLTTSLLDTLQLNVKLAGIDLGLGQILAGTLRTTLLAATPLLDNVLATVLGTLGLSLGEADVRVHGVRCGTPALVQ